MGLLSWLKRLFRRRRPEPDAVVEVKKLTKPPKEIEKIIPRDYKYFEGYSIRIKWKRSPRKIRGKFKPKTAHEKRLWKPDAKLEED